jgi:hypothetical protein
MFPAESCQGVGQVGQDGHGGGWLRHWPGDLAQKGIAQLENTPGCHGTHGTRVGAAFATGLKAMG